MPKRRGSPDLSGPEWILALRQSAGHGRRGRAWSGGTGNFAATLVLPTDDPPERRALRSFVAALAVLDACVAVSGQARGLALKWPNDVLLNGGKLAGILLESAGQGARMTPLAIGIGINLAHAPAVADLEAGALRPVSLLSESGVAVTPEAFLDALAPAYAQREAVFRREGFAPIRADWLAAAAKLGEAITARTGAGVLSGRFETVDAAGNLVLETDGTRRAIAAADIFF